MWVALMKDLESGRKEFVLELGFIMSSFMLFDEGDNLWKILINQRVYSMLNDKAFIEDWF